MFAFGPFELDPAAGCLRREGQLVDLPPRLWSVLVFLAGRAGGLVGKDEILEAVWGHRHVSESVLKTTINSLRGKLGDDAASPRFIETVRARATASSPRRATRASAGRDTRRHRRAGHVRPWMPRHRRPAPQATRRRRRAH